MFETVSMLASLLSSGNPSQAVQQLLNNGKINQQQADMISSAINNGNGQQVVQQLMNSGQMSQQQFNDLSSMAQQVQRFFK